jgi:hypothetical protein
MIDTQQPDPGRPKKPYSEPKLIQVSLRPEEAVLGFCKQHAAGPGSANCQTPAPCSTVNS